MSKLTLYDFLKNYCEGYINADVSDKEVDMLVCFTYNIKDDTTKNNFNKTLEILSKNIKVEIIKLNSTYPLVLNIYEFVLKEFAKIQRVLNNHYYGFDNSDIEKYDKYEKAQIVFIFEDIISGNCGEEFYSDFVKEFESNVIL